MIGSAEFSSKKLNIYGHLQQAHIWQCQPYAPMDTYVCAWITDLLRRVHGEQNDYYIAVDDYDADNAAAASHSRQRLRDVERIGRRAEQLGAHDMGAVAERRRGERPGDDAPAYRHRADERSIHGNAERIDVGRHDRGDAGRDSGLPRVHGTAERDDERDTRSRIDAERSGRGRV